MKILILVTSGQEFLQNWFVRWCSVKGFGYWCSLEMEIVLNFLL